MPCLFVVLPGLRPPELLLDWSHEAGASNEVWQVEAEAEVPSVRSLEGVVVVGAAISPYDPALPREALGGLLTTSVARSVPTLGLGAGAHMLSWALGGRPSMPEVPARFGLRRVNKMAQGRLDVLFGRATSASEWIEWSHLAMTDLPVGSQVLAVDEAGLPQAVRFGPCARGLQGLPFLDRAAVEAGLEACGDEGLSGHTRAHLISALPRMDEISRSWAPAMRRFFEAVANQSIAC